MTPVISIETLRSLRDRERRDDPLTPGALRDPGLMADIPSG